MAGKITFDAQAQAILISRFEGGCDDVLSLVNKIISNVENLDGYESKHKARALAQFAEIKTRAKQLVSSIEDEKAIVKKKRDWLIANEATNPFAGIDIEAPKTQIPIV